MCHDLVGVLDRTTCSVSQPVFHSRSWVSPPPHPQEVLSTLRKASTSLQLLQSANHIPICVFPLKAAFKASFSIMTDEDWNDTVSLTVTGTRLSTETQYSDFIAVFTDPVVGISL